MIFQGTHFLLVGWKYVSALCELLSHIRRTKNHHYHHPKEPVKFATTKFELMEE